MPGKKIPTILGIILVLLILGATVLAVSLRTQLFSGANPSFQPKKVLIGNVKPNQFSISFVTDAPTIGFINYGLSSSMGNLVFDKRDKDAGKQGSYTTHYFNLTGLESGKKYYFKIGSGGQLYGGQFSQPQNCQDFLIVSSGGDFLTITMPVSGQTVTARAVPVSGAVNSTDGKAVWGTLVCLEIPDAYPLTDITGNTGSFLIPLSNVWKKDNTMLAVLPEETILTLYTTGTANELGSGKVLSKNDHPIPPITLGQSFDFIKSEAYQKPNPIQPAVLTTTPVLTGTAKSSALELNSPAGVVNDTLPTFRGKGEPGQILDIQVQSEGDIKATVKVDQNGFWTWTPPSTLPPGEHTVTITAKDAAGNIQKIVRNFQVLAANPIMPVSAGTPSATLKPTLPPIIPTSTPIPTQILIPTVFIPTSIPTAIPTVEVTPYPTPESGIDFPYYIFLCLGVGSILLGTTFIIKNKG